MARPGIPDQYLLSTSAPPPRTLIDILYDTAARFPDAAAIDDGTVALTYRELIADIEDSVEWLAARGIGRGDRIGICMPAGSYALYVAILATMAAGAAYVPVDADDPPEYVDLVFREAAVVAVLTEAGMVRGPGTSRGWRATRPLARDDAWVSYTPTGSGTLQGVAVTHRSAAAFVDAEAQLFPATGPLGPGDRVLAGWPVVLDASCAEMWLAWRHGACLVPAPPTLMRSPADLGAWLVSRDITVVSTAPSTAAQWPPEAFESVRLLLLGGEECPPELAERLTTAGPEVWNTYGLPETTVVACAARLSPHGPVRIGLPLAGWDVAVVDGEGVPVDTGEVGELVIGGVGLARYTDPFLDAERFAPMPTLGWTRAYRSGDLVRLEPDGLYLVDRTGDRVEVNGRRVDLGAVDAALSRLSGVSGGAAAVRPGAAGAPVLVGYLAGPHPDFDLTEAHAELAQKLPAALLPSRLVLLDQLPTGRRGVVDRAALPWPVDGPAGDTPELDGTAGWLAGVWREVLGAPVHGPDADFFALGGGSLSAARLVASLRRRYPQVTVADVYDHPRLRALAAYLDGLQTPGRPPERTVRPTPRLTQTAQLLAALPLAVWTGLPWLVWLALANNVAAAWQLVDWTVPLNWWWIVAGLVFVVSPPGRMGVAALAARTLLSGLEPGSYRRGGAVQLRVWLAERLSATSGAQHLVGTPWLVFYARALGNRIGKGVDLHSAPPVTGMLTLGHRCAVEPGVDLCGYWVDGDAFHVGPIRIGDDTVVGARSTVLPGAVIGDNVRIAAGSAVLGSVGDNQFWRGSPARKAGAVGRSWPEQRPARSPLWAVVLALSGLLAAALPLTGAAAALAVLGWAVRDTASLEAALVPALIWLPAAAAAALGAYALVTVLGVRLLAVGLREGHHPVRSRVGWQLWATDRLMDAARRYLVVVYDGLLTAAWLRVLGAKIGRGAEISAVRLIPKFTEVGDGAVLAEDATVGCFRLGGGWMHAARTTVGRRGVLGISGVAEPGHRVPDDAVIAALSVTPPHAGAGSSWLGSPPARWRRRPAGHAVHDSAAPARRTVSRGLWESCRLIPVLLTVGLGAAVSAVAQAVVLRFGYGWAVLGAGGAVLAAGALAAVLTVLAKWVVLGRIRAGEYPWSSVVWRTGVFTTFVETVAAPWFARAATGTPALTLWWRALGARIGRGVWSEPYRVTHPDLVTLERAAAVNRGCVLSTQTAHGSTVQLDSVVLEEGSTLGPNTVALPAARVGAGATVGPGSLVLRGDEVPAHTRWLGNPIAPWPSVRRRDASAAKPAAKPVREPAA